MKKLLLALLLLVATSIHAQVSIALSAQSYTATTIIKEPWCSAWFNFTPTSYYMEHLMTSTDAWTYGVGNPTSPKHTAMDEQYYYNNSTEKQLLGYYWMKDVWTYPNFNQAPSQAVRVHSSNNGSGNYTDNNSSQKVNPTWRQAYVYTSYPDQGCGGIGGYRKVTVDGRQYLCVTEGIETSLFKAVIHLETSIDAVTGFHYAQSFYHIKTDNGAGFKGVTTEAVFDANGNATLYVFGGTLYDVTPTYRNPPGQNDYTYTLTGVSVVEK